MEVAKLDKDIDKAKGSLAEENVEVRILSQKSATPPRPRRAGRPSRPRPLGEGSDRHQVRQVGRPVDRRQQGQINAGFVEARRHNTLEKEFKANEKMLTVRERTRAWPSEHLQALITEKSR